VVMLGCLLRFSLGMMNRGRFTCVCMLVLKGCSALFGRDESHTLWLCAKIK
jgi:hypothetical protein